MTNFNQLDNEIVDKIKVETSLLDQLLKVYSDLLDRSQKAPPDVVELAAMSSVLHSFYNGIENIFVLIAKNFDHHLPQGSQWHSELLYQMSQPRAWRGAVLSPDLKYELKAYLSFRHFHRHAYSFFLEWEQIEKLISPLHTVWEQVKAELNLFLEAATKLGLR